MNSDGSIINAQHDNETQAQDNRGTNNADEHNHNSGNTDCICHIHRQHQKVQKPRLIRDIFQTESSIREEQNQQQEHETEKEERTDRQAESKRGTRALGN